MADKRMFSKKLVDTDMFLDMPATARLLYYDLAMRADDDGFVGSPRGIMRSTGATNDDMNILLMRRFVLTFDTGVIVIRHWRLHNYIQKDRYKPTTYTKEMAMLSADDKGVYELDTKCIQPVSKPCPQVRDRLEIVQDRDRLEIGQVSISAHQEVSEVIVETPFDTFWREYPKKKSKGQARTAFNKALKKTTFDIIMTALRALKETKQWTKNGGEFIPYPATWLNAEGWEDEVNCVDDNANLRRLYELAKEEESK
jgi:hypothetical protein